MEKTDCVVLTDLSNKIIQTRQQQLHPEQLLKGRIACSLSKRTHVVLWGGWRMHAVQFYIAAICSFVKYSFDNIKASSRRFMKDLS